MSLSFWGHIKDKSTKLSYAQAEKWCVFYTLEWKIHDNIVFQIFELFIPLDPILVLEWNFRQINFFFQGEITKGHTIKWNYDEMLSLCQNNVTHEWMGPHCKKTSLWCFQPSMAESSLLSYSDLLAYWLSAGRMSKYYSKICVKQPLKNRQNKDLKVKW